MSRILSFIVLGATVFAVPDRAAAQVRPALVGDLTVGIDERFDLRHLGRAGPRHFWLSDSPGAPGPVLWVTDEERGTTQRVRGLSGWRASAAAALDERLFFVVHGQGDGFTVLRTDGTTAGTHAILHTSGPGAWGSPRLAVLSGRLHILAGAAEALVLYQSDGTRAGTVEVARWMPASGGELRSSELFTAGGRLWFGITDGPVRDLYVSDGTKQGTRAVSTGSERCTEPLGPFEQVGEHVYFGCGQAVWRAPGHPAGPGPIPGVTRAGPGFAALDGGLYFLGQVGSTTGLYRTEGGSPIPVAEHPLRAGASAGPWRAGRSVFSLAADGALWAARGAEPARTLARLDPDSPIAASDGGLFARLRDEDGGGRVHIDGRTLSVTPLPGPAPLLLAPGERGMVALGRAESSGHFWIERWEVAAAPRALGSLSAVLARSSRMGPLHPLGEEVLVTLREPPSLLRFAEGGATSLTPGKVEPVAAGALRGYAFGYPPSLPASELWTYRRGGGSAELVRAFGPQWVEGAVMKGEALVFAVRGAIHEGSTLWESDGTPEGTRALTTRVDLSHVLLPLMTQLGDRAVVGHYEARNLQLSVLAGDEVQPLATLLLEPEESVVSLESAAGRILVTLEHRERGSRRVLRVSEAGAVAELGRDLPSGSRRRAASASTLYLAFGDALYVLEEGQARLTPVPVPARALGELAADGHAAYFTAEDDAHGRELWRAEGGRVALVRDLMPGPGSSDPAALTVIDGRLLFTAEDPDFGRETFVSDGTPNGTSLWVDLAPGKAGGGGSRFVAAGADVYFVASHPDVGDEPWRVPRAALHPADPQCTSDERCVPALPGFRRRCVGYVCVPLEDDTQPPPPLELAECGCRGAGRTGDPRGAAGLGLLLLLALRRPYRSGRIA